MKKEEMYLSDMIKKAGTYGYVILMIGLYPLFFMDKSIPLISAKLYFFERINIILVILFLLAGIAGFSERMKIRSRQREKKSLSNTDKFALVLAVGMVCSTIFSERVQEAFLGTEGKKFGSVVLILSIWNYFAVSRYFKWNQTAIVCCMFGSGVTFILQIMNHWGINPLHLWDSSNQFAAAIGNVNLNAAYDVLMLAIFMGYYILSKEKLSEYMYSIYLILGFCGLLCCRSNLGIAGIAAAFCVMAWYVKEKEELCYKYLKLLILFGISLVCISMGRLFFASYMFPFDSVIGVMTHPVVAFFILLSGILIFIWFQKGKRAGKDVSRFFKKVYYIFIYFFLFTAGLAILLFLFVNTVYNKVELNGVLESFRFTDESASNRGYIWKRVLIEYPHVPFFRKLFGYGANCFTDFIYPNYYQEMAKMDVGIFWDAHNEFLQLLITTGLLGVIGYFGMQLSILRTSLHKVSTNPRALIPIVVIASLLVQGCFYSPHVTITPLVFIFLGISEGERE